MAKGTDFGGIHSHRDLHLIQQRVEVEPAAPKMNLVDVPGADGSKDLTTQPAGRVTYKDRKITWTFALYPGEDWDAKHRQVSNTLNGLQCHITLDTDPAYYYQGRLAVKKYKLDGLLRQITIEATCQPYKLKTSSTRRTISLPLSLGDFIAITLSNEKKLATPTFEATAETILRWKGREIALKAATPVRSLDIILEPGDNLIEARSTTNIGSLTITYQEGSL